ncbi:MAG: GntR family transcriptional regulator [Ruminococcaceae bacterium]|nr:GntR family transcriptional regulator [Oscillospiraceae bacterium]
MKFIFDNERPIYIQLVEQLRIAVVSGAYEPGERLPSVRELALTAKVNPNTMQRALTELEGEGLIYTERTNGKFVTEDSAVIDSAKKLLASQKVRRYIEDMKGIGISFEGAVDYLCNFGGEK